MITLPPELSQSRLLVSSSAQTEQGKDSAATSSTEESPIVRLWSEGRLDLLDNYCQAVSDSLQANEKVALLSEKLLEEQRRYSELSYQQKTVHKEQLDQSMLLTEMASELSEQLYLAKDQNRALKFQLQTRANKIGVAPFSSIQGKLAAPNQHNFLEHGGSDFVVNEEISNRRNLLGNSTSILVRCSGSSGSNGRFGDASHGCQEGLKGGISHFQRTASRLPTPDQGGAKSGYYTVLAVGNNVSDTNFCPIEQPLSPRIQLDWTVVMTDPFKMGTLQEISLDMKTWTSLKDFHSKTLDGDCLFPTTTYARVTAV